MLNQLGGTQTWNMQKIRGMGLLLIGVAFGVIAQITLNLALDHPEFWVIGKWWHSLEANSSPLLGLLLYTLAGLIFIDGLLWLGDRPEAFTIAGIDLQPRHPRLGLWFTSFGLSGLTAIFAARPNAETYASALTITWLISNFLFIFSFLRHENWQFPTSQEIVEWLKSHRGELLAVLGIVVAAFLIRFWDVELHPYSFINDEGEKGLTAACLLSGNCRNLFEVGWAAQPLLGFLPTSLSIWLLGRTALAVRLVSVVMGTLAVIGVYLFSREAFNKKTALLAALLLTTLPLHVHFSRLGVDNIVDSLSTTLVLWLVFRGIKRGSMISVMAAGLTAGLFFYTYPGSRLAFVFGLATLGYFALSVPGFRQMFLRAIATFSLSFALVAAPILGYFSAHPDYFSARMSATGIFHTGELAHKMQETGKSAAEILTDQFLKSSLVYFVTAAPTNFFNSPKPYLNPLAAIFFILGLAYTVWRIKDARFLALFAWFWAAIILGSTLTGGPPANQRMLMSTSALAILVAIGITKTVEHIWLDSHFRRWAAPICLLAFVLAVGSQDLNFYFGQYRSGHYFEDPTNELTYETRTLIAPLHKTGRFYLICDPAIPYLSFANFEYFSPEVEKSYFDLLLRRGITIPDDQDLLFIATADHKTEIEKLTQLIPGGEWREFKRRNQPEQTLFYSYQIKKSASQTLRP